ncbi:MAG TPA: hypothetical protein VFQ08_07600 [Gaiella sp.]|jgi:hypothetical protein|nr:hypothetical protein [Gaiella sp.]
MTDRTAQTAEETPPAESTTGLETELARGRRSETPFLLVGGTAVVLGAVVAVLAGALLLVWWLA